MNLTIFTDGGARGNPGPAAIAYTINSEFSLANISFPVEKSHYLGVATNNQAEYQAVIEALKWVTENVEDEPEIECFIDSKLIVEQLNGHYKIKNENLKKLYWQVRDLILKLGGEIIIKHIPREKNQVADKLVNICLDKVTKSR